MNTTNRFVVVFVSLSLILIGCSSRATKCPIKTLLLDEKLFPKDTHAEQLFSPVPEDPSESAGRTYYYAPDSVFQEVINWHSVSAAKSAFDLESKSAFDVDKYMGPWWTPNDLYISPIASNYKAACGVDSTIYQCRMVATYGSYSVFFRAEVSDQGITQSKVNELLQAIDKRMSQCVK